jgi:hypothetical protein
VRGDPLEKAIALPLELEAGKARERLLWNGTRPFEVEQPLVESLIDFEPEAEERQQPVGVVVLSAQSSVGASRRLARALEHGPQCGVRQQPSKQVEAPVGGHEIGSPPSQARRFTALAGPRDHELRRERRVDLDRRDRRTGRRTRR